MLRRRGARPRSDIDVSTLRELKVDTDGVWQASPQCPLALPPPGVPGDTGGPEGLVPGQRQSHKKHRDDRPLCPLPGPQAPLWWPWFAGSV